MSRAHEDRVAKALGGRRQPGSGNQPGRPGDVSHPRLYVEAETTAKDSQRVETGRPPVHLVPWVAARLLWHLGRLVSKAHKDPDTASAQALLRLAAQRDARQILRAVAERLVRAAYRFGDLKEGRNEKGRAIFLPFMAIDRVVYGYLAERLADALQIAGIIVSPDREAMLAEVSEKIKDGHYFFAKADFSNAFVSCPLDAALLAIRRVGITEEVVRQLEAMRRITVLNRDGSEVPLTFVPPGVPVASALLAAHLADLAPLLPGVAFYLYVDDALLLALTSQDRDRAYERFLLRSHQKSMTPGEKKTKIGHVRDGFTFLGATFQNFTATPKEKFAVACRKAVQNPTADPARLHGLAGALAPIPGRRSCDLRGELLEAARHRETASRPSA